MSEWAQVPALKADGVSEREIARRLGMNRRTVARLVVAEMPPRYRREPAGSMLDRLEPVLARLVAEHETIKAPRVTEVLREDYGYPGSVDLVRRRLALLRPRRERPAQRTGYAPGQVMQVDWGEMPTRPKMLGRERRVHAEGAVRFHKRSFWPVRRFDDLTELQAAYAAGATVLRC